MNSIDLKILQIYNSLKASSVIRFEQEFCNSIGLLRQNFYRIKKGAAHFTPEHIEMICKVYKVNANWIFSTDDNMFLKINSNQKSVQNINITTN